MSPEKHHGLGPHLGPWLHAIAHLRCIQPRVRKISPSPHTLHPGVPTFQEPGWFPSGFAGHDITRHQGSGSDGPAAGSAHTWVKLGGGKGEQSTGELGEEAGGWSQRERPSFMLTEHHLSPLVLGTFGGCQTEF